MAPTWVLPAIIGISFLISLGLQLVNFKFTDQKFIKEKRKRMKELQKKLTAQSSKSEFEKVQTELLDINNQIMKQTMKPTMYTFIPMLAIFWVLGELFKPYGDLISLPVSIPLFGTGISWLGTYILCSLIFSMVLRPLLTKISERRESNAKTRN